MWDWTNGGTAPKAPEVYAYKLFAFGNTYIVRIRYYPKDPKSEWTIGVEVAKR